jgi:hypothetical protein
LQESDIADEAPRSGEPPDVLVFHNAAKETSTLISTMREKKTPGDAPGMSLMRCSSYL